MHPYKYYEHLYFTLWGESSQKVLVLAETCGFQIYEITRIWLKIQTTEL